MTPVTHHYELEPSHHSVAVVVARADLGGVNDSADLSITLLPTP